MPRFPQDHRDLQRDPFAPPTRHGDRPDGARRAEPTADSPPPATPDPAAFQDPDFDAPESETFRKLAYHVIDEMPGHVIVAFFLVAFMFFYGMAGSLFKLTGRELASLDYPLGVISGTVGSIVTTLLILRIKYRRRH